MRAYYLVPKFLIWLMAGNSTTVIGTLAHSYFLLPDLWVCKPCTSYIQSRGTCRKIHPVTHCYLRSMQKRRQQFLQYQRHASTKV